MGRELRFRRVVLKPLADIDQEAWRRVHSHFRDPDIAYLNGTPPSRMPLWLLKRVLKADSRRSDRATYGVFDDLGDYIGTIELYDLGRTTATLGIIIGERTHWGKGYGTEAIRALLTYAFEGLGLELIKLNTFADNLRAQAAFKKVGFTEMRRLSASGGRIDVQMQISEARWAELYSDVREASVR
ncbi:MAG: GNAT family N-acetyltransferase [Trueperaceae bacterium]|nr:GNAT family N-acetyltransferase [Trueperaceae bacterium]